MTEYKISNIIKTSYLHYHLFAKYCTKYDIVYIPKAKQRLHSLVGLNDHPLLGQFYPQ